MAVGLPVVGTRVGGMAHIVEYPLNTYGGDDRCGVLASPRGSPGARQRPAHGAIRFPHLPAPEIERTQPRPRPFPARAGHVLLPQYLLRSQGQNRPRHFPGQGRTAGTAPPARTAHPPSLRLRSLSDAQWEQFEPLLPSNVRRRGHPFGDNRRVVEGIVYRYRTGIPWRDLPREKVGLWKTVWNRSGAVLRPVPMRTERGHVRGPSVETELVALDVLHHEARLVVAIGTQ